MKSLLLAILTLGGALSLCAQPSATMRPSLLASVASSIGYSSQEEVTHANRRVGEVSVTHFELSVSGRLPLDAERMFLYGLAYSTHELDHSGAILPERLAELSLNLGWQQKLTPQWSLAAFLRPGFYSDFDDFSSDSLNVPALLMANYAASRELIWTFGLNANPFSDNPVLPILGVRWQFAPEWTFNLGFPQSGFTWQASEQLSFRTGVRFEGGSFRVGRDPRATPLSLPVPPSLANTYLDYREVQVGLGADVKLSPTMSWAFDVGAITDRKFDWFDRDYRLDGDTGFYASISLKAAF